MRKVLCTFATGPYEKLLDITLPRMQGYANFYKLDLFQETKETTLRDLPKFLGWKDDFDRGIHWYKVPFIAAAMIHGGYDLVLWMDADALIVRPGQDIVGQMPIDSWQSLIFYNRLKGQEPGTGTWLLTRQMLPILEDLWKNSPDHGEEDTCLRNLLGSVETESVIKIPQSDNPMSTDLNRHTHRMGHEWGWTEDDLKPSLPMRVYHPANKDLETRFRSLEAVSSLNWP